MTTPKCFRWHWLLDRLTSSYWLCFECWMKHILECRDVQQGMCGNAEKENMAMRNDQPAQGATPVIPTESKTTEKCDVCCEPCGVCCQRFKGHEGRHRWNDHFWEGTNCLRPQSAERPALQKFRTTLNALYSEVEPPIAADIGILANCALLEAEAYARAAAPQVVDEFCLRCGQHFECAKEKWTHDCPVNRAAAPRDTEQREIVTPANPHDCRCGERGADGTGEHYQIVADVETKRGAYVPVCVNHIGNYAAYPDNYRISIRAAAPAAPLLCHTCGTILDPNWLNCPKCEGKARSTPVEKSTLDTTTNEV